MTQKASVVVVFFFLFHFSTVRVTSRRVVLYSWSCRPCRILPPLSILARVHRVAFIVAIDVFFSRSRFGVKLTFVPIGVCVVCVSVVLTTSDQRLEHVVLHRVGGRFTKYAFEVVTLFRSNCVPAPYAILP